jgi:HPt (histidine-containing phosphotransfer) domain-containing protein
MFFILNNERSVLAADEAFLEHVGVANVYALAEGFQSGHYRLDGEEEGSGEINDTPFAFSRTPVMTVFGRGYLYRIETVASPRSEEEKPLEDTVADTLSADETLTAEAEAPTHETTPSALDETHETPSSPEAPRDEAVSSDEEEPRTATEGTDQTVTAASESASLDTAAETPVQTETADASDETVLELLDETPETSHPQPSPATDEPLADEELLTLSDDETPPTRSEEETGDDTLGTLAAGALAGAGALGALHAATDTDEDEPSRQTPSETIATPSETLAAETPKEEQDDDDMLFDLLEEDETPATDGTSAAPETPRIDEEEEIFDLIDTEAHSHPQAAIADTDDETPLTLEESHDQEEVFALADEDRQETEADDTDRSPSDAIASPSETTGPFADYATNASIIGISEAEYIGFLDQFVQEARQNESLIRGNDLYAFKKSITSIKDASQLLHLPPLTQALNTIEESTSQERPEHVDAFYGMINRIAADLEHYSLPRSTPETAETTQEDRPETTDTLSEHTDTAAESAPETVEPVPAHTPSETAETPVTDTATETTAAPTAGAGLSTTDSVAPIPFEFSTKAASDELGLPEALVQEFVSDFVQQAEENIPIFDKAFKEGDLDTIQKTAHLLKGAASNLRIDPLAETLKEMQYNEKLDQVPKLFDTFVGQLKALINFIDLTGTQRK